jgi:hypothetical protein
VSEPNLKRVCDDLALDREELAGEGDRARFVEALAGIERDRGKAGLVQKHPEIPLSISGTRITTPST